MCTLKKLRACPHGNTFRHKHMLCMVFADCPHGSCKCKCTFLKPDQGEKNFKTFWSRIWIILYIQTILVPFTRHLLGLVLFVYSAQALCMSSISFFNLWWISVAENMNYCLWSHLQWISVDTNICEAMPRMMGKHFFGMCGHSCSVSLTF